MKGKYLSASLAFLFATGSLGVANAQTAPSPEGFAVNRFEPSERGSEWFALESLDFRGGARPAIGVVGDYQYRPLVIYNPEEPAGDGKVRASIVRNQFTLHPGFAFVIAERLRLAASVPIVVSQDGGKTAILNGVLYPAPKNEQALGDVRLGLDFRILGEHMEAFRLAIGAQAFLPTGSKADYTGDEEFRLSPRLLAAGDMGAFMYAARVSFNYRGRDGNFGNTGGKLGSELGFAGSVGVRLLEDRWVVGPEIFGATTLDDSFGKLATPLEGILGTHYTIPADFRIGAGIGTGLTRGWGSPEVRALFNLEWMPAVDKAAPAVADQDKDGIPDTEDACPTAVGPRTGDPKTNGCPPDRDNDGVLDTDDACVDVPGDKTADPKTNGCPPDRDGDGIYDKDDACIDVPGVKSDDPKKNGCPADSDGDGVLDKDDACVDKPGIKTDDPKTNGCPDPDRDKDGIANDVDACPDEPGKADADPKKNGCPKAFMQGGLIKILDQVKFKTASAQILPGKDSEEVLNAVVDVLKKHPEVKGVRVEGHTDNKGVAANNKKLSQDRAASVVKWLVSKGLDKSIFAAEGFGQEKPIDTNDTDAGRANNRRVEFHILDAAPPPPAAPAPKAAAPKK